MKHHLLLRLLLIFALLFVPLIPFVLAVEETEAAPLFLYYYESDDKLVEAGVTQVYGFRATAEDKVTIAVYGMDGDLIPRLKLTDPSGNLIAENSNAANQNSVFLQATVTVNGLYNFEVEASGSGLMRVMLFNGDPLALDITLLDVMNPLLPSRAFMVAGKSQNPLRMLVEVLTIELPNLTFTPRVFASRGTLEAPPPTTERHTPVEIYEWSNNDGDTIYTVNIRALPELNAPAVEETNFTYTLPDYYNFFYALTIGQGSAPVLLVTGGNEVSGTTDVSNLVPEGYERPTIEDDEPLPLPTPVVPILPTAEPDLSALPACNYAASYPFTADSDTIVGSEDCDQIEGGEGNDYLYGNGGADNLSGGNGNDYIDGWYEDDVISGGDGDDQLLGWYGDDTISGGAGNDMIYGEWGNNTLTGDDGIDTINSFDGNDTIDGGADKDSIRDSGGLNTINGGDGNDYIQVSGIQGISETEFTVINGGLGSDSYEFEETSGFIEIYGDGTDSLSFAFSSTGITLNLSLVNTWQSITTSLSLRLQGTFNMVSATSMDDFITGTLANDTIFVGEGNDTVSSGGGNDTVYGGTGNDTLNGGDGSDRLLGEDGVDVLNGNDGNDNLDGGFGNDSINGGADNDTINGGIGDDTLNGGTGVDIVNGGSGNDYIDGWTENDILNGNDGNDTILGYDGDDTLIGGAGNDQLFGEEGNDTLIAGAGDDDINGNAGDDTLYQNDPANNPDGAVDDLDGGVGTDTCVTSTSAALSEAANETAAQLNCP